MAQHIIKDCYQSCKSCDSKPKTAPKISYSVIKQKINYFLWKAMLIQNPNILTKIILKRQIVEKILILSETRKTFLKLFDFSYFGCIICKIVKNPSKSCWWAFKSSQ